MERLIREGGPTNSNYTTLFVEEEHKSSIIEQGGGDDENGLNCSYESLLLNPKQRFFEQVEEEREEKIRPFFLPNFEDKMPFLQMLQSVESQRPTFSFAQQPYFQQLLSRVSTIQHKQQQEQQCLELESCITHEIGVVAKEEQHYYCNGESSNEPRSSEQVSAATTTAQIKHKDDSTSSRSEDKRKKRKRTTRVSSKGNKQEAETQRMTHIAVERNRRKQMNDHLNVLRLLMPPSFVQRGDQASIIGGAIDFVKELEQHVQFLEAQKRMTSTTTTTTSSSTKPDDPEAQVDENDEIRHKRSVMMSNGFFTSPQYTTYSSSLAALDEEEEYSEEELKMGVADIQVTLIQSHVNLKILTPRRAGQLLRAIAAFEEMRLTVMHLNVTSFDSSVLYSFNLKIEDGCEVGSADDIAAAVYQIFSYIKQQQLLLAGNSNSGGAQSAPLHM